MKIDFFFSYIFLSGVCVMFWAILDFALKFKGALDIIVNLYLIFFGILIIFIEWPRMAWNSRVQEGILYWSYFLARLWGRALLYVFLAILCVADGKSWPKVLVGLYCFFLTFVMYFVAYQAAKKMKRTYQIPNNSPQNRYQNVNVNKRLAVLESTSPLRTTFL